jgi:hypothetical protein
VIRLWVERLKNSGSVPGKFKRVFSSAKHVPRPTQLPVQSTEGLLPTGQKEADHASLSSSEYSHKMPSLITLYLALVFTKQEQDLIMNLYITLIISQPYDFLRYLITVMNCNLNTHVKYFDLSF